MPKIKDSQAVYIGDLPEGILKDIDREAKEEGRSRAGHIRYILMHRNDNKK